MAFLGSINIGPKLRQKRSTLHALLIRQLMVKFGHGNIGFLWLVGEPLILTSGVMVVWSIVHGEQEHGVKIVPFVLTGYTMLTLWRHMVSGFTHGLRHNTGLLFHRSIRPVDILISKSLLEFIGILVAFFVAYIPLMLLEVIQPIDDYLVLLGGWFLMFFFTFGSALTVGSLTELSDTAERFVQPVMYLMLPLTGSFFMASWLPEPAQSLVLYSPLLNAMEMFRGGFFGPSVTTHYSAWYLAAWGLVMNTIGFTLIRKAQNRIEIE